MYVLRLWILRRLNRSLVQMGDLSRSIDNLKGKDVEKDPSSVDDDVEKQKPKTVSKALFDDQYFLQKSLENYFAFIKVLFFKSVTESINLLQKNL